MLIGQKKLDGAADGLGWLSGAKSLLFASVATDTLHSYDAFDHTHTMSHMKIRRFGSPKITWSLKCNISQIRV